MAWQLEFDEYFLLNYFKLNLQYFSTFLSVLASNNYSIDEALGNNHAIKACDLHIIMLVSK